MNAKPACLFMCSPFRIIKEKGDFLSSLSLNL